MFNNISTSAAPNALLKTAKATTQTCPPTTPATPSTGNCQDLWISRELDGVNNIGAVGDLLTVGTNQMSDANKYFILDKYKANNLFDTQDDLSNDKATLTGSKASDVLNNDDMYVAGDPHVGGKGNAYKAVDVMPAAGAVTTMFKDGVAGGRGITANALSEAINKEGKVAYTQYGMVVRDDAGVATKIQIAGGVPTITKPDGSKLSLKPGETFTIGDAKDPVAKLRYATLPGKGEPRLVVDYIEKPTQASMDALIAKGMKPADAAALRSTTTASFGFRIPDGKGSSRSPQGLADPMLTTSNGVKTYYDVHWDEAPRTKVQICEDKPTPPPPPAPKPPVAPNESASIWGDPYVKTADNKTGVLRSKDYELQETGVYNVFADTGININAKLEKQPNNAAVTLASEAGLQLGNSKLTVNRDGALTIDGQALSAGAKRTLADGTVVDYSNGRVEVKTPASSEYNVNFEFGEYGGAKHINIDVFSKNQGVATDGRMPTGLIGETFDADSTVETGPKQAITTYLRPDLFAASASTTTASAVTPVAPKPAAVVSNTLSATDKAALLKALQTMAPAR